MVQMADLLSIYTTQSEMSSFFIDKMGIFNVKSYLATGNGSTDDYVFLFNTSAAADDNGGIIFFPVGTYKIGTDITFPANVTLWFADGAKLSPDSGKTVTINGNVIAGLHQIFTGAGSIAGSLKVNEVYPEWWGAVGDGTTDDTTPLAAAIATGKKVYISQSYQSGAQTITTQRQKIYGPGTIIAKSASSHLFTVQATYVTFSDLRLNGIATSNATGGFAIFTAAANVAQYLTAERVLISGADSTVGFNNAIKFDDGCHFGRVENCIIERLWGNISGTGYGVLIGNAKGCRISKNKMIATSGRGRHGVYTSSGCSDAVVESNYLENFDREGISQDSTGVQSACARNIYSNNTLVGCAKAGTNASSGSIGIYEHSSNTLIIGNTITGSGTKGIAIDGTGVTDLADTVIVGNIVANSATVGIDIIAGVRGIVANNKVYESSTASVGTSPNIYVRSDGTTATSDYVISGNHCAGTTYARSALTLNSTAPAPTNLRVYGNKFNQCQSYTLELNGVTCELDGRIQFRQDSVSYGPIANGASFSTGYTINGADTGDVVTVSHTSNLDGCALYGAVSATNGVTVNVLNLSGASKTIASGSLRIDVWKRVAPLN